MAKFQVGHTLSKGRPPGSINKRSQQFIAILEQNNFCTASAMLDLYKISMECFIEDRKKEELKQISPMESNAARYLKTCADLLQALASYSYPKLKSIDHTTKPDPFEGMTPEQRLQAAESALEMMKLKMKQDVGRNS